MRVAITVQGTSLNDPLDPRFGRAKQFLIIDTDTGDAAVRSNEVNLNATQGAGIQAAQQVVDSGAAAVITGHVGPKAFRVLEAAGVPVYLAADCTAGEALARFKSNKLSQQKAADVEGHWV
jgi:predicted Fe-Mo cluster-binding NifX family protein